MSIMVTGNGGWHAHQPRNAVPSISTSMSGIAERLHDRDRGGRQYTRDVARAHRRHGLLVAGVGQKNRDLDQGG